MDAAIDRLRDGVDAAGEDPLSEALCLTNLGGLLAARAERALDVADIGAAVASAERAVALTPNPSVERKERQSLRGHALSLRAQWMREDDDRRAPSAMRHVLMRRHVKCRSGPDRELDCRRDMLSPALMRADQMVVPEIGAWHWVQPDPLR